MERHEWHVTLEGADAPFSWASCECLIERGQFAATAEALKRSARSGAERWAIDQYDHARDAYRNQRYNLSLDHAGSAVAGGAGQHGNRNDYRALFLLGLLKLGSFTHRDPALLDLADAEDNFVSAGVAAIGASPTDSAWCHAAAGWAAYCRGRMEDAQRHTMTALALRSKFGEAQYLAAKISLRQDRLEAAANHFGLAVAVHPSFASRSLRDPDFIPVAAKLDAVIERERHQAAERAVKAFDVAVQRGGEVGLLESEHAKIATATLPPGSGAASANSLLILAREVGMKNTLYGYFEMESLAKRAKEALNSSASRSRSDQRSLIHAVQKARKAIAKLTRFGTDGHLKDQAALADLTKAEALLTGTDLATSARSIRDFLLNQEQANAALNESLRILENCKQTAIGQADAHRTKIEEELNRSLGSDVTWERYILKGSFWGFAAGMVLAMITGIAEVANGNFSDLLRLGILAISTSVLGAIFGALVGPMNNSHVLTQRMRLETAKTDLQATIEDLRSVLPENG